MKNKKGFTLTEILATIVILGIILAIAVPSYNALSKKFEKEYYDKLDKSVLSAAKSYWKDNPDNRPKEYLESANIKLNDLITNKYIDSVKEYRDKNDSPLSEKYKNGYALIIKDKDEYDYAVCLSGPSNSPEKEKYCDKAWLNNDHITKCDGESCPNAESSYLYYDPKYLNNEENQNKIKEALGYTPNYKKTNDAGTTLKQINLNGNKIYPENITSIDKKNIGIYKVEYPNEIYKEVEVFQYPTPNINIQGSTINVSIPEDYKDSNGKEYFGRIIADADAEGKGTSFKDFQISENGETWVDCNSKGTSYEKTYNDLGEHKVKFRVVDNLGNVGAESDEQTVVVKTEETLAIIPKLENGNTYSGTWDSSNTSFTGNWTNQNVKFEIIANLGTNGKLQYSINSTEKGEIKLTDGKATIEVKVNENASFTGTYKFWITDSELKKEAIVNIDKIPPKLTVSTKTESGINYTATKEYKCGLLGLLTCTSDVWTKESIWLISSPTDNESGIDNVSYKKGLGLINYPLSEDQNYSDYIDDSYIEANITVAAYDKAGNATSVSTKVKIDKISPTCSLSIDTSNEEIIYKSHDWEVLGIGAGSGIENSTITPSLTEKNCSGIFTNATCYKYDKSNSKKTVKGTVVDKAGNSSTCSITIPSETTNPSEVELMAPTITLNKTSTSSSPSTTNINFTLSNPNSVGTLQYKIGSGSWTNYSGSAVTLINTTGSKTVYARVTYNGKYSSVNDKTGYCNKDIATHERQTNGKDNTGCWIEFWMTHNSSISGNTGVTANRFQYAYWNAKKTTDTKNKYWGTPSYNSMLSKECGSAPPSGVRIFDSSTANGGKNSSGQTLTKKLYQKYSSQYYCFAIREYRATEITSVNRWKVWYKNAHTTKSCPTSGYTSQGYGG